MWFSIDSTFLSLPFMRELRSKKTKGDSRGNDRAFAAIEIICFSLDAPVKRDHFQNKAVFDSLVSAGILETVSGGYSAQNWLKTQKRLRARRMTETKSADSNLCEDPNLKRKFADNVTMTNGEAQQLIADYGKAVFNRIITRLSSYKKDSGKHYKSDYDAIIRWVIGAVQQDMIKEQSAEKLSNISTQKTEYQIEAENFSNSEKGREYRERLKKILGN